NRIEVQGAVYRPGMYELGEGTHTVRELIGRAEGIVANAFDNGLATGNDVIGLLSAEYEVTGTYQPLELRIVIPGKFTAGEKRRICVGRIVLTPTDNY
ncbi:MAG: hypothetical protein KHX48_12655, partial [Alistipes sp.]|nr:hypothetical protein [Alistipes sp.]